jgi:hypothetical protein
MKRKERKKRERKKERTIKTKRNHFQQKENRFTRTDA